MVGLAEQQPLVDEESSCRNDQDIGALFRQARQERNLSIEGVAKLTHIRQLYLNAIENGHFDQLPGKIYTIGFIKTYAHLLDLDACEILRRLNLDKVDGSEINKLILAVPTEGQERPTLKLVLLTSFLALVLGTAAVVYNHWEKEISQHLESWIPSKGNSDTEQHLPSTLEEATPLSGDEIPVQPEENVSTPSETDAATPKEVIVAEPSKVEVAIPSETKVEVANSNDTSLPSPDPLPKEAPVLDKITLLATKDSWVQVLDGQGKSVYVRLMHTGETYEIPQGDGPYQLNTGNAGGIRLKLNTGVTSVLGSDGKVMRGIPLTSDHIRQLGVIEEAAPAPAEDQD